MLTIDARGSHGFNEILALGGWKDNIDINSANEIILVNSDPCSFSNSSRVLSASRWILGPRD